MILWEQACLGLWQVETGKETDTDTEEDGEEGTVTCRGRWRIGGYWKGRIESVRELRH